MSQDFFYPPGSSSTVVIPPGGATAANQVIQISEETAIAASVSSIDTKTPTVGQKTMANSSPVVIASDQSAVHTIIDSSASIAVTGPLTDAQLRATPVPVNISSGITNPLPVTDAAAEASLSSIDTKLSSQATAANQATGNASLSSIDTKLSSQATAANQATEIASLSSIDGKLVSDTAVTTGSFSGLTPVDLTVSGLGSVIAQFGPGAIGAPLAGTVQFFASVDGTNFLEIYVLDLFLADGQFYSLANNVGFYSIGTAGFTKIRMIGDTGVTYSMRGVKSAGTLLGVESVQLVQTTSSTVTVIGPINTNGTIVNTSLTATTASSASAPSTAVGFVLEAPSTNTDNIRWCIGGTASTTVGMLAEPGRDSGFIPCKSTISVCATVSGTNKFSIQWIQSS